VYPAVDFIFIVFLISPVQSIPSKVGFPAEFTLLKISEREAHLMPLIQNSVSHEIFVFAKQSDITVNKINKIMQNGAV
jgi:hypothetical protein